MRVLVLLVLLLLPAGGVFAVERITSFDARIEVRADASIRVEEQIVYDFGEDERHGIFRTIPYSYQARVATYRAEISDVVVTDAEGVVVPFEPADVKGSLLLKIGDPEATVTGAQTYVIRYTVSGPFLYFDEQDELYWNVTGMWQTGIERASVLVDLPPGAPVLAARCFRGVRGGDDACESEEQLVNEQQAGYHAEVQNLAAGEGFTFAVAFPKGVIAARTPKTWHDAPMVRPVDYTPLALPVIVIALLGYLWYTRGRDPEGRATVVTQFMPPEGVSPAVAGIVYNERIEPRELSAEIVRLAVEGHIRIHQLEERALIFTKTDYLFERVSDSPPNDEIQATLLSRLFDSSFEGEATVAGGTVTGTRLSKMQHKFADARDELNGLFYEAVLADGYFVERPDLVRRAYMIAGVATIAAGIASAVMLQEPFWIILGIALGVSGLCIMLAGILMPARTRAGVRLKEHIEGFKRYLMVAEKERIAFHNAPERTPELFDRYLPYAMALGVERAWAEQFGDIYFEEPSWHTGSAGAQFSMNGFVQHMQALSADVHAASMPASSGVSGGSVGGGFGGGGGGSW